MKLQDAFWSPRLETNRAVTVWSNFKKCEDTGRFENFDKAAGKVKADYNGTRYDDSDVYKCIEGASYSLALVPDPKLDQFLDDLIPRIAAAQEPDGYLYTIRVIPPEKMPERLGKKRWERVYSSQELYNCGHLYEAAVAHLIAALDDPDHLMARLAASFHGHPGASLTMVGVTGTNGKTTVTYLLEAIWIAAGWRPGVLESQW